MTSAAQPFTVEDFCGRKKEKPTRTFRLEADLMEAFEEVVELDGNMYKRSNRPRLSEALREAMVMYINHKLHLK